MSDRQKVWRARSREKLLGIPMPPDLKALSDQFLAEKAERKAAYLERKKERTKASQQRLKAKRNAEYRERYANDPEFRAKQNARRKDYYHRNKIERTEKEKEEIARRRRENLAKARRLKPVAKPKPKLPPKPKIRIQLRKPGRILASLGWKG